MYSGSPSRPHHRCMAEPIGGMLREGGSSAWSSWGSPRTTASRRPSSTRSIGFNHVVPAHRRSTSSRRRMRALRRSRRQGFGSVSGPGPIVGLLTCGLSLQTGAPSPSRRHHARPHEPSFDSGVIPRPHVRGATLRRCSGTSLCGDRFALTVTLTRRLRHWIGTGPRGDGGIPSGALAPGAHEGTNDFGDRRYGGPCPPPGSGPHRYEFRLYALNSPVTRGLRDGLILDQLLDAIRCCVASTGTLTGTYERL